MVEIFRFRHTHTLLRPADPEITSLELWKGVFRRNLLTTVEKYQFFGCGFLLWQAVVSEECIPVDQFVEHLLPSLLSLASDPVPNVRVLLAKALRQTLLEKGMWTVFPNLHSLKFTKQQLVFLFRNLSDRILQTLYKLMY